MTPKPTGCIMQDKQGLYGCAPHPDEPRDIALTVKRDDQELKLAGFEPRDAAWAGSVNAARNAWSLSDGTRTISGVAFTRAKALILDDANGTAREAYARRRAVERAAEVADASVAL